MRKAFAGNMESGNEGEGDSNIFISPMEGENQYGTYEVTYTYSNKFKCMMPLLNNVKGYTGICVIHSEQKY